MEEGRMLKHRIGYQEILRAVGHFCDELKMDEICLLEFDKGIVLQGIHVQSTGEGYIRQIVTQTWTYEQIAEMAKKSRPAPGSSSAQA